jgi:hypothetical protein
MAMMSRTGLMGKGFMRGLWGMMWRIGLGGRGRGNLTHIEQVTY